MPETNLVFDELTRTLKIEYYCNVEKKWGVLCDVLRITDDGEIELEGYLPENSLLVTVDNLPIVKIKYGSFDRTVHWLARWLHCETYKRIKEKIK